MDVLTWLVTGGASEDTVFPQDAKLGLVRFKGSTVGDEPCPARRSLEEKRVRGTTKLPSELNTRTLGS